MSLRDVSTGNFYGSETQYSSASSSHSSSGSGERTVPQERRFPSAGLQLAEGIEEVAGSAAPVLLGLPKCPKFGDHPDQNWDFLGQGV